MTLDILKTDLLRIREAFEQIDKTNITVGFEQFPYGSCGDTCEVLAEILGELGYGSFRYICGVNDAGQSHAWLKQESIIIDITADQFENIDESVYLGVSNEWYDSFEIIDEHPAGYRRFNRDEVIELSDVHCRVSCLLDL